MRANDLMAAVFPKLVGCQENQTGPIEIPDHPIVRRTVYACMQEAIDIDGLKAVLDRLQAGEIRLHAKDTTEPSPFAHEMLNSKPYPYLDDAPLEERRARAVTLRRSLPENSRDLGALDPDAIERVVDEARPDPRDPEELHEALLSLIAVRPPSSPVSPFPFLLSPDVESWFDELVSSGRAAIAITSGGAMWFAAENLAAIQALYPSATIRPKLRLPPELAKRSVNEDDARLALFRGQMEIAGADCHKQPRTYAPSTPPPSPGNATSSPPASPLTAAPGSMSSACPATLLGAASQPARAAITAAAPPLPPPPPSRSSAARTSLGFSPVSAIASQTGDQALHRYRVRDQ